jgi:hypothetical protein
LQKRTVKIATKIKNKKRIIVILFFKCTISHSQGVTIIIGRYSASMVKA